MLKNKIKTYVLFAAVIVIWATIGFQILSALNPELPENTEMTHVPDFRPMSIKEIDTFSVSAVDRDPFLGTITNKEIAKAPIKKMSKPLKWKPLVYHGSIGTGKEAVYIVTIGNKQRPMKKGQVMDTIELLGGDQKHIVLKSRHERKTITLKQ